MKASGSSLFDDVDFGIFELISSSPLAEVKDDAGSRLQGPSLVSSLTSLDLSGCSIGDAGASALAELVEEATAQFHSHPLSLNRSLQLLNRNSFMKNNGAHSFWRAEKSRHEMTPKIFSSLRSVAHAPRLALLNLGANNVTDRSTLTSRGNAAPTLAA